jgi:hypothetical protein
MRAEPRSEPDSGNPTVRDRRGALGNVVYGGIRNPSHNRKSACRKLSTYGCARPDSIPTTARCVRCGGGWKRAHGVDSEALPEETGSTDRPHLRGTAPALDPTHIPRNDVIRNTSVVTRLGRTVWTFRVTKSLCYGSTKSRSHFGP